MVGESSIAAYRIGGWRVAYQASEVPRQLRVLLYRHSPTQYCFAHSLPLYCAVHSRAQYRTSQSTQVRAAHSSATARGPIQQQFCAKVDTSVLRA
eukprot:3853318-Rhodomonas_salina.1